VRGLFLKIKQSNTAKGICTTNGYSCHTICSPPPERSRVDNCDIPQITKKEETVIILRLSNRTPQKAALKLDAATSGVVTPVFGTPPLRRAGNVFEYSLSPMECVFVRCRENK
jgi:hypothetical protein